jgi:glycosyltransferase involved in cell wall biosynthesis
LKRIFVFILFFIGAEATNRNIAPKIEFPDVEKEMVVCIPSYNNELYYKKNLDSLFSQDYENYRVIYIDDASTDNTLELVTKYVSDRGLEDRITIIHNDKNAGPMANWYKMIHMITGDEIVISLDGDDWFAHDGVLHRVNQAYADEEVWVTYGNYSTYPGNKVGQCRAVRSSFFERGKHKRIGFYWSHLRTFYARLFNNIPVSQFQNKKGFFYPMTCDVAIMLALLDIAPTHVFCIPSVLYRYNVETALSENKMDIPLIYECVYDILEKKPLQIVDDWRD